MADFSKPPPTMQPKSRVLAALDNPDFLYNTPPQPLPSAPIFPPPSLGPYQTPMRQRPTTPSPSFDYESAYLGIVSSSQRQKRKSPDHESDDDDEREASGSSPAPPRGSRLIATQGFNLHYDQEGPVYPIDRGGPDQEMKMAEFVSRGIDNAAHGLTTQKAMEKLGLME
ncbi:hypothetical protein BD311DRAFT_533813 [Dichomitus squalens]|uniref:Uncharacterized protein n=1 Tax=Dichomitus squalens TaxID=114155 RepID=A0A4Q9MEI6_9APHY|nr:hypothetical protein BD311DRAFT_533813 [Dichomitus squalens]